jgi:hypothetical protein
MGMAFCFQRNPRLIASLLDRPMSNQASSRKWIESMDRPLTQISYCFYVDDNHNVYFCVSDFVRAHELPDTPELRRVIAEDMKRMFPGVFILEEQN